MAVVTITKENFQKEVLNSADVVLVDFWASWCGPCRMIAPVIDEVAQEIGPGFKIGKINVDEEPELAAKFQVMGVPSLLVFKNGKVTEATAGFHGKEEILGMLKRA